MKSREQKIVKMLAVILTAALLSGNLFAKNLSYSNLTGSLKTAITEKMVQNLAVGLKSENAGLKKSCIYFAGFYEIQEMVKPLIEQLDKEPDVNTRILIVLAIYKIGTKEGIKAIEKIVTDDPDVNVRMIGNAILSQFNIYSSR